MQHLEFISIDFTHELQRFHGLVRFVLVDLAHRKSDMDQHPITGDNTIGTYEHDVHVTFNARNINFGNMIFIIHHLYDLTWNTKTHTLLLFSIVFHQQYHRRYFLSLQRATQASPPPFPHIHRQADICIHTTTGDASVPSHHPLHPRPYARSGQVIPRVAAAMAAWPRLKPPSLGGTRRFM